MKTRWMPYSFLNIEDAYEDMDCKIFMSTRSMASNKGVFRLFEREGIHFDRDGIACDSLLGSIQLTKDNGMQGIGTRPRTIDRVSIIRH